MNDVELNKLLENVAIPISTIEKQIGIPTTVLQKAMKGKRQLPKKWSILLKDYVARKLYLGTNTSPANQNKKKGTSTQEDTPKIEKPTTLSFREQLYNKKMGI